MTEEFTVTIKVTRVHSATITVRAKNQAEADQMALDRYWRQVHSVDDSYGLGLPPPWNEHEPCESDPEIDTKFCCVDCAKSTMGGEYYMVSDALWATTGLAPDGGMLCLACCERRIGRELTLDDFTAMVPSKERWQRHVARRRPRSKAAIRVSLRR
jgi:hypothetical protein